MESSALELSLSLICLGAAGFVGYRLSMILEEVSSKTVRRYFGLSDESRGVTVQPGLNAKSIYDHAEMEDNFVIHFTKEEKPVRIEILEASKFLKKQLKSIQKSKLL